MFQEIKSKVSCTIQKAHKKATRAYIRAGQLCRHELIAENGAMYVDEGGNMLIAVVVGMLLLVSIYALFKTAVVPNITNKTNAMFTYSS